MEATDVKGRRGSPPEIRALKRTERGSQEGALHVGKKRLAF